MRRPKALLRHASAPCRGARTRWAWRRRCWRLHSCCTGRRIRGSMGATECGRCGCSVSAGSWSSSVVGAEARAGVPGGAPGEGRRAPLRRLPHAGSGVRFAEDGAPEPRAMARARFLLRDSRLPELEDATGLVPFRRGEHVPAYVQHVDIQPDALLRHRHHGDHDQLWYRLLGRRLVRRAFARSVGVLPGHGFLHGSPRQPVVGPVGLQLHDDRLRGLAPPGRQASAALRRAPRRPFPLFGGERWRARALVCGRSQAGRRRRAARRGGRVARGLGGARARRELVAGEPDLLRPGRHRAGARQGAVPGARSGAFSQGLREPKRNRADIRLRGQLLRGLR
mmetsp:Transcript_8259/g.24496  ORF Transcript_8259/g.24496 Transcript_8259/m.24496 type:complete len:338 (-) Transcript_8259:246-1259(-)